MWTVTGVPWWGVASAAAAPVLLVGGWTLAAARQRGGFDPGVETISALAALDAEDRWLMTAALAGLGCCHLTTAAALRPAAPAGRLLLAAGGVGTVLVATYPLPVGDGDSPAHTAAAALAFGALAVWPALGRRRGGPLALRPAVAGTAGPLALRPAVAGTAAATLLGLVGWFVVELVRDGDAVGFTERLAAGAQAVWPLVAVLSARRRRA